MHIIDMTLYLDIELSGLDEVTDAGRFVVMFDSPEEYERSREWLEEKTRHPFSRITEIIPAEAVDWKAGPFITMLYNGAIEYAEFIETRAGVEELGTAAEGAGGYTRSLQHQHA